MPTWDQHARERVCDTYLALDRGIADLQVEHLSLVVEVPYLLLVYLIIFPQVIDRLHHLPVFDVHPLHLRLHLDYPLLLHLLVLLLKV